MSHLVYVMLVCHCSAGLLTLGDPRNAIPDSALPKSQVDYVDESLAPMRVAKSASFPRDRRAAKNQRKRSPFTAPDDVLIPRKPDLSRLLRSSNATQATGTVHTATSGASHMTLPLPAPSAASQQPAQEGTLREQPDVPSPRVGLQPQPDRCMRQESRSDGALIPLGLSGARLCDEQLDSTHSPDKLGSLDQSVQGSITSTCIGAMLEPGSGCASPAEENAQQTGPLPLPPDDFTSHHTVLQPMAGASRTGAGQLPQGGSVAGVLLSSFILAPRAPQGFRRPATASLAQQHCRRRETAMPRTLTIAAASGQALSSEALARHGGRGLLPAPFHRKAPFVASGYTTAVRTLGSQRCCCHDMQPACQQVCGSEALMQHACKTTLWLRIQQVFDHQDKATKRVAKPDNRRVELAAEVEELEEDHRAAKAMLSHNQAQLQREMQGAAAACGFAQSRGCRCIGVLNCTWLDCWQRHASAMFCSKCVSAEQAAHLESFKRKQRAVQRPQSAAPATMRTSALHCEQGKARPQTAAPHHDRRRSASSAPGSLACSPVSVDLDGLHLLHATGHKCRLQRYGARVQGCAARLEACVS
jgi:hypothetical protein